MEKWQEATTRGNTEFTLKYFGNAILLYNEARDIARHQFSENARVSCGRAISQVVITHFNLADCYIALNQYDRASEFYYQAQQFLLNIGSDEVENTDELYAAIDHAMGHVNSVWQQFLQQCQQHVSYDLQIRFYQSTIRGQSSSIAAHVLH